MPHNRTPLPDQAVGDLLLVFVRLPVPGEVKTRLAKRLGPVAAAEAYRAFAEWVFTNTVSPAPGVWRRWACFTPRTGLKALQTWLRPFPIDHFLPQAPGDLGTRLMAATGGAFHARASKVVVIGTDCVDVTQNLVGEAFEALDESDVVLGPSHDGGYYLLGLRGLTPKLFQRIPWSTDQVLAATRERAKELGLSVQSLPALHDIDRPADLAHLPAAFLEAHPEIAPMVEEARKS
ncbi:MAG: TIGR04282 family arsenosugar biosynthesis glycosyltransferase [Candidatus Sumerlaeia bacterium]|nr:TIGR04282 family arsenosugar biosynthesis glycosyltransferase [Candidatus Sumerlaeia bacterium]